MTTTIPSIRRSFFSGLTVVLLMTLAGVRPAAAQIQQGLANPPPPPSQPVPLVIPHSQGKTDSTLELPSMPAKQGADSLNIPPSVPQGGQELVLPTRELRQQPGYEQVTVTVTEPRGTYVTGLQKGGFKLYMDGQQPPTA